MKRPRRSKTLMRCGMKRHTIAFGKTNDRSIFDPPNHALMKFIPTLFLAGIACLITLHSQAATRDVHGVKLEERTEVQGKPLQLNGAGTRFKAIFKVYVAGLYLEKPAKTPDEVINQPGPKRLSVTMVRDIDAAELGKLLTRGMEDNVGKSEMSPLIPGLIRMSQIFSSQKKMTAGDQFVIDWLPGTGSVISVKGQPQGEPFLEPEFFRALMMIWLGPVPADRQLKNALLGNG